MNTVENAIESESIHKKKTSNHPIGLIQILFQPTHYFSKLRVERKLGINILLILAIYGIVSFFLSRYLLQTNEITSMLSPELQNDSTYSLLYIGTTILSIIQFLFNIALITVIYKVVLFFLRIGITFKGLFHIVFIAQVPIILGKIVNLLFIDKGTIEMPITSLGFTFQNMIESNFLVSLFTNFEFFNLWSTLLIGWGIHVCLQMSKKKSFLIAFLTWGAFILISSLILTALS